MAAGNFYTADNPVFASFCFYAALMALKTLLMSFLTGLHRYTKKVSAMFTRIKLGSDFLTLIPTGIHQSWRLYSKRQSANGRIRRKSSKVIGFIERPAFVSAYLSTS